MKQLYYKKKSKHLQNIKLHLAANECVFLVDEGEPVGHHEFLLMSVTARLHNTAELLLQHRRLLVYLLLLSLQRLQFILNIVSYFFPVLQKNIKMNNI